MIYVNLLSQILRFLHAVLVQNPDKAAVALDKVQLVHCVFSLSKPS